MNFKQCALIFERYPTEQSWKNFFLYHQPFWDYITNTAKELFPINMLYPAKLDVSWDLQKYQSQNGLRKLEDFFALYFLLIMYQFNHKVEEGNFSRDQELWKHLWDRECWSNRVTEVALVEALKNFKLELNTSEGAVSQGKVVKLENGLSV